jgi:hypothetical protein
MPAATQTELRQWEREPVAIPVSIVLKANEVTSDITTATLNISLSGVSISTKLALVPKQVVEVVIQGQFCQTIPARVVWARKATSGNETIAGLKFLQYKIALAT